jgi:AcrR family transcriptional regulator
MGMFAMQPKDTDTRANRLRQRSQDRREGERKELRQLILDAAGELFARNGYTAFSLRGVAEHIGYSPGAIYRYFDDKDDLLFSVADEGFKLFRSMQRDAASTQEHPAVILRAMARAYVDFGIQHPNTYHLMFMERADLLFKDQHNRAAEWLSALADYQVVFEAAVNAGVLRTGDTGAMSDAWWSLLHGIVALGISMNFMFDEARIRRLLEAALDMFFQGYGIQP